MNETRERETWREWAQRMKQEADSPVRQLMDEGLSLDAACIVTMLGKVHNEIVEAVDRDDEPPEPWEGSR